MNTATVDIGNSSTKVDFWASKGFLSREILKDWNVNQLFEIASNYNVEAYIVSSVRKDSSGKLNELKDKAGCPVVDFNETEIRKYYDLSEYEGHLGPDRMAAILGAERILPGKTKMVVDLGTAMTIDVVDKSGKFMGGNISLGLYTRLKALAEATSKLPDIKCLDGYEAFGHDTAEAIKAGAINGVSGEIIYSFQISREGYGVGALILTGGDGEKILPKVEETLKVIYDPYLVGRGLDFHLRSHYF